MFLEVWDEKYSGGSFPKQCLHWWGSHGSLVPMTSNQLVPPGAVPELPPNMGCFSSKISFRWEIGPPKWGQADAGYHPASAWPHLGGVYLPPHICVWRKTLIKGIIVLSFDDDKKHVFGNESGRYSRFWHFEKGILHEIARSSDWDYSRGLKPTYLINSIWFYWFSQVWGVENAGLPVCSYIILLGVARWGHRSSSEF